MKYKITNFSKFLRSIVFIILLISTLLFLISTVTLSHTETKYKTICIASGDTLWSISKEEKKYNTYFLKEDVRDIISELKEINKIKNSNLTVGQELVIPTL